MARANPYSSLGLSACVKRHLPDWGTTPKDERIAIHSGHWLKKMEPTTISQTRVFSLVTDEAVAGQVRSPHQTHGLAEDTIALIESARQAALERLPEIFGAQDTASGKDST